ncbi:hypothetical protein, partial [Bradyrhizobium uaiense]|uniref:hypothetical protein n=1 Tax=Bradyrhizobium uaiense TaxID=2594946 RepID=UPI0019D5E19F
MMSLGMVVPSITSVPLELAKVMPPLAMLPACSSTLPPEIVIAPVDPPDETISVPPANTATLLVTVPATLKVPPLETLTLWAVAPDRTFNMPPLLTVVWSIAPPDDTFTVPPEIPVPELVTPVTTPPE